MTRPNAMSTSDEIGFWETHMPRLRGVGLQAAPEPAPVPVPTPPAEPDVAAMSMQEFAQYRAERGLDSSDFVGVAAWHYRHLPNPTD